MMKRFTEEQIIFAILAMKTISIWVVLISLVGCAEENISTGSNLTNNNNNANNNSNSNNNSSNSLSGVSFKREVYSGPSTTSTFIKKVPTGAKVKLIKNSEPWYQVQIVSTSEVFEGWIYGTKTNTVAACVPRPSITPKEGALITQKPTLATSTVGSPQLLINRGAEGYQCADSLLASTWKKADLTKAAHLEFQVATAVYPKSLTVRGIQSWFTRLEAYNGSQWKTIWMGEASQCVTEMVVRQTSFKSNRYRLTSPMGRDGGVYSLELKGASDVAPIYPVCSVGGNVCEAGTVCAGATKNSSDTAQCCAVACTKRPYAFNLGNLVGGDSRDHARIANAINVNFMKSDGDSWWSELPAAYDRNEKAEMLDLYDKFVTANRSLYLTGHGSNSGSRFSSLPSYQEQLPVRQKFPHIRGTFFDDASNLGYAAAGNLAKQIVDIYPKEHFFLTTYSVHSTVGLAQHFGPQTAVGRNSFLATFGTNIPCVGTPNYAATVSRADYKVMGNPLMIGSYVSSYTAEYCRVGRKMGSVWDPNNAAIQNRNWSDGIRAGTRGFLFWNPYMYSKNGRDRSYYGGAWPFSFAPNIAPSQAYNWTPPKVIVSPAVNAIKVMMDDLYPSCRLCPEDKDYKEDGFFGGACCAADEVAIGNRCAAKTAKIQWAETANRNQLEGIPAANFGCFSERANTSLVTVEPNKEEIFELEYTNAVNPEMIVLYGKNLGSHKIEAFDGTSWREISAQDPGITCIQSLNIPAAKAFVTSNFVFILRNHHQVEGSIQWL